MRVARIGAARRRELERRERDQRIHADRRPVDVPHEIAVLGRPPPFDHPHAVREQVIDQRARLCANEPPYARPLAEYAPRETEPEDDPGDLVLRHIAAIAIRRERTATRSRMPMRRHAHVARPDASRIQAVLAAHPREQVEPFEQVQRARTRRRRARDRIPHALGAEQGAGPDPTVSQVAIDVRARGGRLNVGERPLGSDEAIEHRLEMRRLFGERPPLPPRVLGPRRPGQGEQRPIGRHAGATARAREQRAHHDHCPRAAPAPPRPPRPPHRSAATTRRHRPAPRPCARAPATRRGDRSGAR